MALPMTDPYMLLSVINTWLRDRYAGLETLCEEKNINRKELEEALEKIGYTYDAATNCFQ